MAALHGDIDGDGVVDYAVGGKSRELGYVWVHSGANGLLLRELSSGNDGDAFGFRLSSTRLGARSLLAVGAPGFFVGAEGDSRGRVYVFEWVPPFVGPRRPSSTLPVIEYADHAALVARAQLIERGLDPAFYPRPKVRFVDGRWRVFYARHPGRGPGDHFWITIDPVTHATGWIPGH